MWTECTQIMERNTNNGENMENRLNNSEFPKGMRVLAVDDNQVCLTLLTRMLNKCHYQVTSLMNKTEALALLKQEVDNFDIVLTNVNMDEMDGFKLLEAGLELDIPVVMISACESEAIVMKGVTHGAVDYIIKPVRLETVKIIWQHVYRKTLTTSPTHVDNNPGRDEIQGVEDESKRRGKRKCSPQDVGDVSNDNENSNCEQMSKKTRIKWTRDLHDTFLNVVQMLGGYAKAVPTKIHELMNDPSLTREQVASHLQKYRNYLKKEHNKVEEEIVPTSTIAATTTNNYQHLFASSSNGSSVATTLSNRSILGNTSRTLFPPLNFQYNNPWLAGPSAGYTRPLLQQQQVDRPNQLFYPQQSIMHTNGNYMNTVPNTLAEPLYPQLPEEISNPSYSMSDYNYETPSWNILDYPALLEYSEDGKKDQYYRAT